MPTTQHWADSYVEKTVSAKEAVSKIRSGQRVFVGSGCGEPQELVRALTARADSFSGLEILRLLKNKEMSVSEIAKETKMGIGNLSQHLSMMKQRHILESRKDGAAVYYSFSNDKIIKAFTLLREALLEQLKKDASLVG